VLHSIGVNSTQWGSYWERAYKAYQATAGMRELDLSPLVPSDEDHLLASPVGTRWFGNLFNRVSYDLKVPQSLTEELINSWRDERYSLLKEEITGLQTMAMHDSNVRFDPNDYIIKDTESRNWMIRRIFSKDPLIAESLEGTRTISVDPI